ncbi:hypothetical protein C0J52_05226 [Blattella germanica]|nr:hypothetical protein C0J52_05226 [Blattella germanica]
MKILKILKFLFLKSKVFARRPHNIIGLEAFIREEISSIPVEMLQLVMGNMRSRMQECIHREGGHLKGIILRKLIMLVIDNEWQTFAISIAIVLL